jgi:hypothetical protein
MVSNHVFATTGIELSRIDETKGKDKHPVRPARYTGAKLATTYHRLRCEPTQGELSVNIILAGRPRVLSRDF